MHTDHAVQGFISYSNYAQTPKSTNRDNADQGLGCGDTMWPQCGTHEAVQVQRPEQCSLGLTGTINRGEIIKL